MNCLHLLKKPLLVAIICFPVYLKAQTTVKANWQNLDLKTDSVFGISTERAYNELLKNKPHTTVLVAVLDGGIDINHEDLKQIIWTNPVEIAGNKIDDDKNGYTDDVHGWNFIGSAKGNVEYDNLEQTRLVRLYTAKFANTDTTALTGEDLATFKKYTVMRDDLNKQIQKAQHTYNIITKFNTLLNAVLTRLNNNNPSLTDFKNFDAQNNDEAYVKRVMLQSMPHYNNVADFRVHEIDNPLKHYKEQLDYHLNINYDPRTIVGDNYTDASERYYGNNDVVGPNADHGSHVAGIIAAVRDNNIGINGVANDVKIMVVRSTPTGDERDKDVANAIRYAANNGAKVISMSFGKSYAFNKNAVDEAVKFAMSKDVLIVHAAGNDNRNTDDTELFPNPVYADKSGEAKAWIEVGASGLKDDETLKAFFSNYGKHNVDVFAPGVKIYSTTPNSTYTEHDGTSMAAPVVAGLAALIRSYYPHLTALQVKEIITKSVAKVQHKVTVKNGEDKRDIAFADLCSSGGIVNAYNALKLAATYVVQ